MSTLETETGAGLRAGPREWAGLAVLALPVLLLALDNSVLFLALPHLSADLEPGPAQLLWIMDVYGFMMAGFLITMGTVGDRIGHRRLLLTGAFAFGGASLLAAYATSAGALIAARVLLGVAGATLAPSSLALISTMFRDARQRAAAIGIFTACFMGGGALGPVVGGALLESFWWGSVFLVGVPVMVVLLVTAPLLLPENRNPDAGRVDLASVALSLAAILPIIFGLKEAAKDPVRLLPYAAIAAGAGFAVLFARRQRALDDPFLDLRLFRNRAFAAALAVLMLGMVLQGGVYLMVSQYLQRVAGLSPLDAGLWLVLPALALVAGSLAAPPAASRIRPGTIVAGGLAVTAAGLLAAAFADGTGTLIAGMVVAFLGSAPLGALGIGLIVGAAPKERAGAASAMAETSGEFGVALGIAALGTLGTAVYRARVSVPGDVPPDAAASAGESLDGAASAAGDLPASLAARLTAEANEAFMTGLAVVLSTGGVLAVGLAVLVAVLLRDVRPIGSEDGEDGGREVGAPVAEVRE